MKRLWFWQMKKTRQKKDHKKGQKERDNGMMADGQLTGSVKFASNYNWENVQKDCGFDRCNYNYNYNWENVWKDFDRCLWQSVDCWWLLCEWDQDWKAFRSLNLVEVELGQMIVCCSKLGSNKSSQDQNAQCVNILSKYSIFEQKTISNKE